jgi:1-acyl-sn-glycerol-3-phosphate acyltransferase
VLGSLFIAAAVGAWTLILLVPVMISLPLTFSGDTGALMARVLWAPFVLWISRVRLERDGPYPALDPGQPYIFVSNHQGFYDIPAAYATIRHRLRFIAKRSLVFVPFVGWFIYLGGHIMIDRHNRKRSIRSLSKAAAKVRRGTSLLVYPEGTRSPDGKIHGFKKGPFVLAIEAQVPIVPVAVEGSHRVLRKHDWSVHPGSVRIRLGEPIPTRGLTIDDRDELVRRVRESLIAAHLAIGGAGAGEDTAGETRGADDPGRPAWSLGGS